MWFKEDLVVKKRKGNRRRKKSDTVFLFSVKNKSRTRKGQGMPRSFMIGFGVTGMLVGVWMLVSGFQFVGGLLLENNDRYLLEEIMVTTDGQLKDAQIRRYTGIEEGQNIFSIDLDKVRQNLLDVSIVRDAEVKRILPGKLQVRLSERIAIARLGRDTRSLLAVDRSGHVLPVGRARHLPSVSGIRDTGILPGSSIAEQPLVLDALEILDICDTSRVGDIVKIRSIDVRNPEYLDIQLERGERVRFLRNQLEWRLNKLAGVLQEAYQDGKQIASADMTVDKNFPVLFR